MRAVDLTGLASIRESAMRERGWAAVSIRDIAANAGVSSSLVVHHFGTKARLREAVDARVTEVFAELLGQLGDADAQGRGVHVDRGRVPRPGRLRRGGAGLPAATADRRRPGGGRVVRVVVRRDRRQFGGPGIGRCAAAAADAPARAAFLLINDLAVVLLRDEVARVLGVDPLSRPGLRRWGNTVMEIYRDGAFTDETGGGRNECTD